MMSMPSPTASRIAGDACLGVPDRRQPFERHRRRHRHRLEGGEPALDHRARKLGEALRLVALVEVLHLAAAEVAVEPHVVADRPAPELVAGDAVHLAEDVPERDVDPAHRGAPHDAVRVPEVLAEHHLPEVLDPGRILADDQLRNVLDGADDCAGVPLERRLTPAVQPGLVGDDPDEHPVPHPGVADVRLDGGDLHATPRSNPTLSSITRSTSPRSTFELVIP